MKPLRYSTHHVTPEDEAAVLEALRSDWLTQGPVVQHFEEAVCAATGAKYCAAVSSGTAALHLALLAAGIGPGDNVATPPLSFVATSNAILYCGGNPLFLDVERATGNVSASTLVDAQGDPSWPGIKALIPVHYAGRPCDVDGLARIAGKGVVIIEDACHAFGASFPGVDGVESGRSTAVGSCRHSLATVFSFHPVKPLTTGEGGAITTNDEAYARELRLLRSHGRDEDGRMVRLGMNYRMPDINAALGLSQLARVGANWEQRMWLAVEYDNRIVWPELPVERPSLSLCSSFHLYPIRIKGGKRDHVKAFLNERGIGAQIHYPSIAGQPFYREMGYDPADYPEAQAWAAEELSLPLHAQMDEDDVARVVNTLKEALSA